MQILIIGGSGFLGNHLALKLQSLGHNVTIFDNKKIIKKMKNINFLFGSIADMKKISNAAKGKDVIYNFAAISDIEESLKKPKKTAEINIIGNLNAIECALKYKTKKFIFASTIYVHSAQGGFYKVSKQASELFLEEYYKRRKFPYTILRFGTIYGPGSSKNNSLKKIVYKAMLEKKLEYSGSKNAQRRFLHVDDAVNACVKAISQKYNNQNLLITGEKMIKLTTVLKIVKKIFQLKTRTKFLNKKGNGHYDISPYSYKPKKDKKFFIRPNKNLTFGIKELRDEINKELKNE